MKNLKEFGRIRPWLNRGIILEFALRENEKLPTEK
jgi:hypothetical protein